jgi:hypothetical protein
MIDLSSCRTETPSWSSKGELFLIKSKSIVKIGKKIKRSLSRFRPITRRLKSSWRISDNESLQWLNYLKRRRFNNVTALKFYVILFMIKPRDFFRSMMQQSKIRKWPKRKIKSIIRKRWGKWRR